MSSRRRTRPMTLALIGFVCLCACQYHAGLPGTAPTPEEIASRPEATVVVATTPAALPSPTATAEGEKVIITVVYDNNVYDPRLQTAWGFGCVVERGETTILFDTGGDGEILLSNMAALGLDHRAVDVVVLSHNHGDHTGGLGDLLATGVRPTVYVPKTFPVSFKTQVKAITALQEVDEAQEISSGIHTTGQMGTNIVEQALVIETAQGLVVITGCAHPGITELVHHAGQIGKKGVYLVLGGFHLGSASRNRIESIVADFREMGVHKVAPCHCTGDQAIAMFRSEYGDDFIKNGAGKILEITP